MISNSGLGAGLSVFKKPSLYICMLLAAMGLATLPWFCETTIPHLKESFTAEVDL